MLKTIQANTYDAFMEAEPFVLSLAYRGSFTDEMTANFVDISENTIEDTKGLPKVSKKVSFLLVECFQNIVRHGSRKESKIAHTEDDGIFCFRNKKDEYSINGVNYVQNKDVLSLLNAIESVNSADKMSLKEMYRAQLTKEGFGNKGGAGLGFIEMARRSGQKIDFRLEEQEEGKRLFSQQISFLNTEGQPTPYLEDTFSQYHYMKENKVILQYKGDFSQRSIIPIIHILESNFNQSPNEINKRKRMIQLLVEMLQNIAKHGAALDGSKDGIFSISEQGDQIIIETGNLVNASKVANLDERLKKISQSGNEALVQMHRNRLLESIDSEDKLNSGLGLIEIARYSHEGLIYDLRKVSEELSFLTLRTTA